LWEAWELQVVLRWRHVVLMCFESLMVMPARSKERMTFLGYFRKEKEKESLDASSSCYAKE